MTTSPHGDPQILALAAAGSVAGGVAAELRVPLRELRESLAVIVEILDKHLNESEGPTPYPWEETKALRERVAQAYLSSRRVARLTGDLADAINSYGHTPEAVDVNKLVEVALSLTRHRIASDTEVFIDFGKVPVLQAVPGAVILLLARLLMIAADSARDVRDAAVSIKTRLEEGEVAIYIADSGSGLPREAEAVAVMGRDVAEAHNGAFEGTSEKGSGSVFELRLKV
jgi:C4-dicarboxylate-specific signal transduction histidine kinase